MGKIKSKPIRKTARILADEGVQISKNFEKNKKILRNLMLSKKLRNQIAGLLAKTKKHEVTELKTK